MKPYIFTLLLIVAACFNVAAQQNQQPDGCSITDGCLTYKLNGATQHDADTYILSYTLTVNCTTPLEYIAFQLPEGAEADEPSSYFASQNDFTVQDGKRGNDKNVVTSYNAIQFTAKTRTNISNGASYTFEYPISVTDYNALANIQVQAKVAGAAASNITLNHKVCAPLNSQPQMPECRIDLGSAIFGFTGATDNNDGTTTVGFMIQNNLPDNVGTVAIEVPGAPANVTVETDNNGGVYHATYKYKTTYTDGILYFEAQNANGYANGATDAFELTLPTDAYFTNPSFTLSLQAAQTTVATGFNTETCEDQVITPLPVELLSFEGKATRSGIELDWETASESNNQGFEVERSLDGKAFNKIGFVEGAGTSSINHDYTYTDYVQRTGVYYYRLRQVDYDGTATLSKIVPVKVSAKLSGGRFAVYPNPATGSIVTVSVGGTGADVNGGVLQIVDMSGKVMHARQVVAGSRGVEVALPELRLPKGMYVVNLLQGTDKQTQKLIIQ